MLRFILAVLILAALLKLAHQNPYVGFGIWLFLSVSFMIHTTNAINCDDIKYERKMLRTPENRRQYYDAISNSNENSSIENNSIDSNINFNNNK